MKKSYEEQTQSTGEEGRRRQERQVQELAAQGGDPEKMLGTDIQHNVPLYPYTSRQHGAGTGLSEEKPTQHLLTYTRPYSGGKEGKRL